MYLRQQVAATWELQGNDKAGSAWEWVERNNEAVCGNDRDAADGGVGLVSVRSRQRWRAVGDSRGELASAA